MMGFVSHSIRAGAARVSLCIVLAGVSAAAAQPQPGIALSSAGAIYLWDIADAGATRELAGPLPDAIQPGTCHWFENGTLVSEPDTPSCLSYYIYEIAPQDAPRLSLSGHIAFNNRAPDLQYRGLELRGVSGVESCGERDNCDTLYIVGFETEALVDQAMRAARPGKPVFVSAQQVNPRIWPSAPSRSWIEDRRSAYNRHFIANWIAETNENKITPAVALGRRDVGGRQCIRCGPF